jgi:hypothetical protein
VPVVQFMWHRVSGYSFIHIAAIINSVIMIIIYIIIIILSASVLDSLKM